MKYLKGCVNGRAAKYKHFLHCLMMEHLYFSTGRKPSQMTRKFARIMSLILDAQYENRGKRSVDEICGRAEKFGCTKIAFIYEKKGNPSLIQFYGQEKGWLDEELMIFGINIPEREGRIPKHITFSNLDAEGEKIAGLFGLENDAENEKSTLIGVFSQNKLEFISGKEKVLDIKCKLVVGKGKAHD
jgi:hypothetical protein